MSQDDAPNRVQINENVMLPMDVQLVDNDALLIYATSTAKEDGNDGHVYVKTIGSKETVLQLTEHPGDYGPPACTQGGDTLWVAHTAYQDKHRSLWLHGVQGNQVVSHVLLASKIDNPHLAVFEDQVHLVWEDYSGGEAQIVHARFAVQGLLAGKSAAESAPVAVTASKSYKPQLISDGHQLYLFYEWFCQGRYRLMVRCLTPGWERFSDATEIGFDRHNDQAISLAIQDHRVVAVWENSSPLDKGYEWVSPSGSRVIIPNFGHGWRVNTRMGLRRVSFVDQTWHLEDLLAAPDQTIESQEAAGTPRIHVAGNTLYVSYLKWDYGSATASKGWQICTKTFDGERWIRLDATGLVQKQRVRPAVLLEAARGTLHTFGQSPKVEKETWSDWTQENAATYQHSQTLPELPYARKAAFVTNQRAQLVQPVPAEDTRRVPYSVHFEDGERMLLWGDLHMHTNLSGCSLGARFHCTEIEEKYRFCRDVAQLDFALNTDHDSMRDVEWHRNRNAAHFHDLPGHFVAFHGYEWTCSHFDDKPNYGHYNILYQEDGPLLRTRDARYNSVSQVAAALAHDAALAIPHHPGDNAHLLDWNAFDPSFAPLVEIFQVRGSYEYDNCPMHPVLYGRNVVRKHSLQYGLNRGFDFGFTAGGEHEGVGVTGVYATVLTREAIFEALRERRTFGTTGDRIVVDFRLDRHPMGSTIRTDAQTLTGYLAVVGTDMVSSIVVIKNGHTCHEWQPGTLQFTHTWQEDRAADPPASVRDYYYVVVTQRNAEMAWTSPIFVYL